MPVDFWARRCISHIVTSFGFFVVFSKLGIIVKEINPCRYHFPESPHCYQNDMCVLLLYLFWYSGLTSLFVGNGEWWIMCFVFLMQRQLHSEVTLPCHSPPFIFVKLPSAGAGYMEP